MTTSCMGGWCAKRDHCANYHAATVEQAPAERLCTPGRDGDGVAHPVVLHKQAGEWERMPGLMAAAGFWNALA